MDNVLLVIYVIILIGCICFFRYRKKKQCTEGKREKMWLSLVKALGKAMTITGLVYGGFFVGMYSVMTYADYYIFTESRKETIAERTGITEGEGVDFTHFLHAFGGPDGPLIRLELECDTDGMTFLENCCDGTLSVYTVDGIVYDVDEQNDDAVMRYTVQERTNDPDCVGFYRYYHGNRGFNVWFYTEDDHYRVMIQY